MSIAVMRELASRGFARETVTRVQRMLYSAEYKRRQNPPGPKLSAKVLGASHGRRHAFRPSVVNISGMSYGSLSPVAVEALANAG